MLIICRKCNTRVEGESIKVFGFHYHPTNCFVCFDCNKPLTDSYFEINNLPYCELDYKRPRPGDPVSSLKISTSLSKRNSLPPQLLAHLLNNSLHFKANSISPKQVSLSSNNIQNNNQNSSNGIPNSTLSPISSPNQSLGVKSNSLNISLGAVGNNGISIDDKSKNQQQQHQNESSQHQHHQHNHQHVSSQHQPQQHELPKSKSISSSQELFASITNVSEPKPIQITKSRSSSSSSSSSSGSPKSSGAYTNLNFSPTQISAQHIHPAKLTKGNSIGSGGNGEGLKVYLNNSNGNISNHLKQESQYKCHKCRTDINGTIIYNAVGDQFHPNCFTCYICRNELKDGYFTDENGYLCAACQVLLNDRNKQNRTTNGFCSLCYKRFNSDERHISIDQEKYHSQCFKCCVCKDVISGSDYSRDRVTSTMSNYCCSRCLNSGKADRCPICSGAIVGGASIYALGKTYHPRCFKCVQCHSPIPHGTKFSNDSSLRPTCITCSPIATA